MDVATGQAFVSREFFVKAMQDIQQSWACRFQALEQRLEALEEKPKEVPQNPVGLERLVAPAALTEQPPNTTGRKRGAKQHQTCFVCHTTSGSVHKHRDLGVYLDDKCRKQIDTFRQGGIIKERRSNWTDALRAIPNNPANNLQSDLLAHLEKTPGLSPQLEDSALALSDQETQPHKKRRVGTEAEEAEHHICSVCQEEVNEAGQELTQLSCSHRFHRRCIEKWLRQKDTCPTCRTHVPCNNHPIVVSPPLCAAREPTTALECASDSCTQTLDLSIAAHLLVNPEINCSSEVGTGQPQAGNEGIDRGRAPWLPPDFSSQHEDVVDGFDEFVQELDIPW